MGKHRSRRRRAIALATTIALAGLLQVSGTMAGHAYDLNCRFWQRMPDGKWAPLHPITIDIGGARWTLKENTTLLPDPTSVIDLSAALEQQCAGRRKDHLG